ncbi:keratin-associated protein 4-9-like [Homarus americanus]|uniref:keratin-associated protein 4-9-like n=1 Tax=Homarus americanus TaxID=6706 RepID=UPI001C44EAFE|nr:keratin-associated protein 4-9-like [Homarus americanus]
MHLPEHPLCTCTTCTWGIHCVPHPRTCTRTHLRLGVTYAPAPQASRPHNAWASAVRITADVRLCACTHAPCRPEHPLCACCTPATCPSACARMHQHPEHPLLPCWRHPCTCTCLGVHCAPAQASYAPARTPATTGIHSAPAPRTCTRTLQA